MSRKLTDRQERFCQAMLTAETATEAAIIAGYKEKFAGANADKLLKNTKVSERLAELRAERAERVKVKADDVLKEWIKIGFADMGELVEYRRGCCRYCYGENHKYQRKQSERDKEFATWFKAKNKAEEQGKKHPPFDEKGGVGFNPNKPALNECPECFGDGEGRVIVKDTRKVSEAARALYAGVKETKDGIEIKAHDKNVALDRIARHIGMFVTKHEVNVRHRVDPDELKRKLSSIASNRGTEPNPGQSDG